MKKIGFLFLAIIISVVLGYSLSSQKDEGGPTGQLTTVKRPILRVGLVADSHNENDLLEKALGQAQGIGVNFVIGLGDWSNLGTVEELTRAKAVFDKSGLEYFVAAGDRDGWESRQKDLGNFGDVFGKSTQVFDRAKVRFVILDNSNIYMGISDEDWRILEGTLEEHSLSAIKKRSAASHGFLESQDSPRSGLRQYQSLGLFPGQFGNWLRHVFDWRQAYALAAASENELSLLFVFAHKTPFHPQSSHVMGEDSEEVSRQARKLLEILEENKVDGFFSGDIHFFAQYESPGKVVKMTTIGAVARDRNFQGPRFAVLSVFDDYSWEVEDVEIR